MVKKIAAGVAAAAFLVTVPAGTAMASNGADDPVGHCRHHCDDGPGHH